MEKKNIEIKMSSVLPEEEISTSTTLKTEKLNSLLKKGYRLSIGIEKVEDLIAALDAAFEAVK